MNANWIKKNSFKIMFLIILILSFVFIGKKIYQSHLLKKLHALQTVTLEGEQGFLEVNRWLTLCEDVSLKNVTKYQTFLPKLGQMFLDKTQSPEDWMVELINQEFSFYKLFQKSELISSFSHFLDQINQKGLETVKVPLCRKKETVIDDCLCDNGYISQGLVRYKIDQGKLYVKNYSFSERIIPFTIFLNHLHQFIPLPDMDFFLTLNDFYEMSSEKLVPILSFCRKKQQYTSILIPDCEMLRGYNKTDKVLDKKGKKNSWNCKLEKAFWRGSTSNGLYNLSAWRNYPRAQLTFLSLKYPEEIDARFTKFIQGADQNPDFMQCKEIQSKKVKIANSLRYKYLIDIDGNASTYSRFYWILRSNCLPLKQDSDFIQWYYGMLKPYEHFIPIREDCSDLVSQVHWARGHDEEVKQIAEKSAYLAKHRLSTENAYVYLYLTLIKYYDLFKSLDKHE